MIKLYTWEFSVLVLVAIVFFFIIMILRKQLYDFFGFDTNLIITFSTTLGSYFITGMLFGLRWGFMIGLIGLIAGLAISYFTGGSGGGDDGGYY
jgi:uncharacterized membrane protein YdjX (TVP38/TMEM64 family)